MRLLLLTGGSHGIGLAIAHEFLARGYTVIEFSRTAPHSYSVATDFAYPLEAQHKVDDAIAFIEQDQLEDLLIVSNAATLEPIGPTSHKQAASILQNLSINIASPILFLSTVIAKFQDTSCRKIVANISAGSAHQGVYGWSLYCATKIGMESFIRSLTIEQQSQPHPFVPINIDPGVVDTQMHFIAASASPTEFPAATRFAARRALGELTPPDLAARAIAKLLTLPSLIQGETYYA